MSVNLYIYNSFFLFIFFSLLISKSSKLESSFNNSKSLLALIELANLFLELNSNSLEGKGLYSFSDLADPDLLTKE